ncbi:MAG: hypothetical protein H7235_02815 [Bdellovibrionaceae bacterium]|nr:hypothetical protein [Pseudobdellovibrionaceae bacterium]
MELIKNHNRNLKNYKKSEKGMAIIESIPVLFMIVVVFNFSLGFFGAIHSGILNSIGSYNYTLETFRFRSNLTYFRPGGGIVNYARVKNRVHGTIQDGGDDDSENTFTNKKWPVTVRGITFNYKAGDPKRDLSSIHERYAPSTGIESDHAFSVTADISKIWGITSKSTPSASDTAQTPRIWIKTVYGICLTADCIPKN